MHVWNTDSSIWSLTGFSSLDEVSTVQTLKRTSSLGDRSGGRGALERQTGKVYGPLSANLLAR